MAAAGGGNVGEDLAAEPDDELGDRRGLRGHLDGTTFMAVADSTTINCTADPAGVKVERQHPAGSRAGVVDGYRARLAWRVGGQGPGVPRGVSAAAVAGDPDMRSARYRERDRMPGGLCGGAREAVKTARARCRETRRVARRQC